MINIYNFGLYMLFRIIIFLLFYFSIISCSSGRKEKIEISTDLITEIPEIDLDEDVFNFGEISEGEIVTHRFKFKNSGEGALIINSAKGSCGCTVPKFPKDPISSGEEAYIEVTFNSENRKGIQNKKVTIVTNAIPNITVLTIKGNIK